MVEYGLNCFTDQSSSVSDQLGRADFVHSDLSGTDTQFRNDWNQLGTRQPFLFTHTQASTYGDQDSSYLN